jgi:hypothetical protein
MTARMGDLANEGEYSSEEIDPWTAAAERLTRRYQGRNPVGSGVRAPDDVAPEILRSIPYGVLGGLADQLGQGVQAAGAEMSQPEMVASAPTMEQGRDVLESLVGQQHRPEGPMGQVGAEFGRVASMPANWAGPGGALYKAGFNTLSAVGGEAGERLAPAGYEGAGRVLGSFSPMATERALPFIERIIPTGSVGAFGAKPPPSKRDLRSGAEIIADNERKYFAEQQAKAQAKAAAADPAQTGWTFRDVDPPHRFMGPGDWRTVNRAIETGEGIVNVDLPIRSLYATQKTVNPDYAGGSGTPFVIKKDGKYFVQDGHHKITAAAGEGRQTVGVRLVDLDRTDRSVPLMDLMDAATPSKRSPRMGDLADQSVSPPPKSAPTYEDNVRAITTSRQALVDHANKYGLSDSQVEKLLHDLMDYRPLSTKMFKEFTALRSGKR